MKEYIQSNKKGLILVILGVIIITFAFIMTNKKVNNKEIITINYEPSNLESFNVITDEEKQDLYLNEYNEEIEFFARTFGIDKYILIEKLKTDNNFSILTEENFTKKLIEYLFYLEELDKTLFTNNLVSCSESKEYIIALINYFSNLYGNVDFSIAAGIAQVESSFTSQYMLNKNNVFGGMSGGRLIGYKNIEYGILKYIKLLSEGYFEKGLTTVESIGVIYNPTYNEAGVKIAKPTWVYNVNNAKENYNNYISITNITELNQIKEAQ